MYNTAFLMLDGPHHIHHILPIALELSQDSQFKCTVFTQSANLSIINNISQLYPNHQCVIKILSTSLLTSIKYRLKKKQIHSQRIIQCHVNKILKFDIILSATCDFDQLISSSENLTKKPIFFCTQHGAGDRPINFFTNMHQLDLAMFMGEKYLDRFITAGAITPDKSTIIGYPKFDVIPKNSKPQIFANNKPTVIYNPHFEEPSSWWRWGLEILEYFYNQNEFNLIFAPHTLLFKRILKPKVLPKKYFKSAHMVVDLGSEKAVDMTYTQAADIYLGDISSQVYEFIRIPRPCFFLNPYGIDWQNQTNSLFSCWSMGPVINQLPQLWKELKINPLPNSYLITQQELFKKTFSITDDPAGLRASNAIRQYLKNVKKGVV